MTLAATIDVHCPTGPQTITTTLDERIHGVYVNVVDTPLAAYGQDWITLNYLLSRCDVRTVTITKEPTSYVH